MKVSELDYELPRELIAQRPAERRDGSRLLVYDRASEEVRHRRFSELPEEVAGELVVVNDTRVVPGPAAAAAARVGERRRCCSWSGSETGSGRDWPGRRGGCGWASGSARWSCSSRSAKAVGGCGSRASRPGRRRCRPTSRNRSADADRYQTVYAREEGSAAAPTAGLHFTAELLGRLDVERVTLHVGLDTFRPLNVETLEEHELHGEQYSVAPEAWERIRTAPSVLAVGTTTVRVLESVARGAPLSGRTSLFVTPGFEFRRVDRLLTNFHLPRSTLLALVMAFAGVEETRELYRLAIAERYRFYSFGDALLVL